MTPSPIKIRMLQCLSNDHLEILAANKKVQKIIQPVFTSRKLNALCDAGYVGYTRGHLHTHVNSVCYSHILPSCCDASYRASSFSALLVYSVNSSLASKVTFTSSVRLSQLLLLLCNSVVLLQCSVVTLRCYAFCSCATPRGPSWTCEESERNQDGDGFVIELRLKAGIAPAVIGC